MKSIVLPGGETPFPLYKMCLEDFCDLETDQIALFKAGYRLVGKDEDEAHKHLKLNDSEKIFIKVRDYM